MSEISAVLAGYSVVACCILCLVYLFSLPEMKKTIHGKVACFTLLATLALVQIAHFLHFLHGVELLSLRPYILLLAFVPVTFYFFFRELLFHGPRHGLFEVFHAIPVVLALVLPGYWAALSTFVAGSIYTFYIYRKVLRLRSHIPRFRFEKFFFTLFFLMTLIALALGLALPLIDPMFFYHAYAACISLAMVLVISALMIFPELLSDVWLASETVYTQSKLGKVNIEEKREQLEHLMREERIYDNEDLSLSLLASQLDLSSHQLSELINSSFGHGFSRYVRTHRVEAAKRMLIAEPKASVLSVGLSTGFKSQSSFYTAFRELTGETPAAYRKSHS